MLFCCLLPSRALLGARASGDVLRAWVGAGETQWCDQLPQRCTVPCGITAASSVPWALAPLSSTPGVASVRRWHLSRGGTQREVASEQM